MNSNLITRKIAVPIVVLILCAASVVSVAWSYNVNHTSFWSKSTNCYNMSIDEPEKYELDGDIGFNTKVIYNVSSGEYETTYTPTSSYLYKSLKVTISCTDTKSSNTAYLKGQFNLDYSSEFAQEVYSESTSSISYYSNATDAKSALDSKSDSSITSPTPITSITLSNGSAVVYVLAIFGLKTDNLQSTSSSTINKVGIILTADSKLSA